MDFKQTNKQTKKEVARNVTSSHLLDIPSVTLQL